VSDLSRAPLSQAVDATPHELAESTARATRPGGRAAREVESSDYSIFTSLRVTLAPSTSSL